ncbi:MAG: hypothetical protein P8J91_11255 [Pirellulaceae bacterium]|nr:hypothetical protein [Pirellulaceae bacterium]MDG2104319.1 hypothetical protein [Pirellulaceae bacterium]
MASLEIEIEFTNPDKNFRTDQHVTGVVRMQANRKLKCRSVQLVACWETHGLGDITRENYHQEILRSGDFAEGETGEFTFDFAPPNHPLTYHGHLVNVDHYVLVRADTPWDRAPQWKEDFHLRVGAQAAEPIAQVTESQSRSLGLGKHLEKLALFLLCAAFAFAIITGSVWFLLLAVPAIFMSIPAIRKRIARRRLGEIKWITPHSCHPRETLPFHLEVGPLGNVRIREITIQLRGTETTSSNRRSSGHTHLLHQETHGLAKNPIATLGEVLQYQSEMVVPDTEAWSLDLPGNRIYWSLSVVISLAGWPDYVETRIVQVQDRVGKTPAPS